MHGKAQDLITQAFGVCQPRARMRKRIVRLLLMKRCRVIDVGGNALSLEFFSHALANSQFPDGPERATYFRWANLVSSPVPHNMLLNVRVRPIVAGVAGSYGPACRFKIDATACVLPALDVRPEDRVRSGAAV